MYSDCDLMDDEGEEGEIVKERIKEASINNEINKKSFFQKSSNESRPTLSSGIGADDSLERDNSGIVHLRNSGEQKTDVRDLGIDPEGFVFPSTYHNHLHKSPGS